MPPATTGPGPIIDAPRRGHAVDRRELAIRVELPEDSAVGGRIHAQGAVVRTREHGAGNHRDRRRLRGIAPAAGAARWRTGRGEPGALPGGERHRVQPAGLRAAGCRRPRSTRARASTADPHSMPPRTPPCPARYSQTTSPIFSGSSAKPTPDFCPITIKSRPRTSGRASADCRSRSRGRSSRGSWDCPRGSCSRKHRRRELLRSIEPRRS